VLPLLGHNEGRRRGERVHLKEFGDGEIEFKGLRKPYTWKWGLSVHHMPSTLEGLELCEVLFEPLQSVELQFWNMEFCFYREGKEQ
jgi:hypothetical protein